MSSELVNVSDLSTVSTEELRSKLAAALAHTAQGLTEMAGCVRELEARGEDLSALRLAVLPYLRRIGHGQLLPEIVVSYAGSPKLLAAVSALPIPDQHSLLDTGSVPVAVFDGNGGIGVRQIDPRALSTRDIQRVFAPDGIRPPVDQVEQFRKKGAPRVGRRYQVRVDRTRREVIVGQMRVPVAEVLTALSEAAGWGGEMDEEARKTQGMPRASTNLTEEEKERLVALSKALQLSEWEIVRRAILVWLL